MGNPFAWVAIPVDNMERARRFYEDVFETTLQRMPDTEFERFNSDAQSPPADAFTAQTRRLHRTASWRSLKKSKATRLVSTR